MPRRRLYRLYRLCVVFEASQSFKLFRIPCVWFVSSLSCSVIDPQHNCMRKHIAVIEKLYMKLTLYYSFFRIIFLVSLYHIIQRRTGVLRVFLYNDVCRSIPVGEVTIQPIFSPSLHLEKSFHIFSRAVSPLLRISQDAIFVLQTIYTTSKRAYLARLDC